MSRDIMTDMDTYGANLFSVYPYTNVLAHSVTANPVITQPCDDNLFKLEDIITYAKVTYFKIKNRVSHKLSGAMVGDATAPIGIKYGDAIPGQCIG